MMKIYSKTNPSYFMEFKKGKFDTALLKTAISQTEFTNLMNEFKGLEEIDSAIDKLYTFNIDHPYAEWVNTYLTYASKLNEESAIPDAGYWRKNKFKEIIINKKAEKGIKELTKVSEYSNTFITTDVETTGLNPELDSIIQLSAVLYVDDKPEKTFDRFVTPSNGSKITDMTTDLTGITQSDVDGAPTFEEVHKEYLEFLESCEIIVGHNLSFDLNMISAELKKIDSELPNIKYFDTLKLSKRKMPYLGRGQYKLENLKKRLPDDKVKSLDSHNALNDCYITGELFILLKGLE